MRRFMVGCLASVGLLSLLFTGAVGGLIWWGLSQTGDDAKAELPRHLLLSLAAPAEFAERQESRDFTALFDEASPTLRRMVEILDYASRDGRVQGVALDVSAASGLPLYQAQELGGALARLRQQGKKIVAFADTFGESDGGLGAYLLASHADRIVLQPSGEVSILGLSLERPYFAELLKSLGVTVRAGQRHEFKGGIDPLTGMAMPADQKTALQAVLTDLLDRAVVEIAHNRGLANEEARRLIDNAPYDAVQAHGARLIDAIGYWDDAMSWLQTTSKTTKSVELAEYSNHVPNARAEVRTLALIQAVGPIVRGSAGDAPFAGRAMLHADDIADALRQASRDVSVAAIVLRIDSPGGSYVASDTVFHAIAEARRAGKPVVASIGGIAASGGYYIALAADRIVAQPTSLTGSIGVYSLKPVLTDLWDKIGVRWDGVRVGQHAGLYSPNRDFTDAEWASFQQRLDWIYADFTDRVTANRRLTPEQVNAVARGRIWTGGQAQANGLIDRLGAFNDAVAEARHLAKIPDATPTALVAFPREPDKLAKLMRIYRRLEQTGDILAPVLPALERLSHIQARIQASAAPASAIEPVAAPAR